MWTQVKRKHKAMSGTFDALLPSYLQEYIFVEEKVWRKIMG